MAGEADTQAQEQEQEQLEQTLSPAEEKALKMGWRPQEEWDGDPDEWVDAKEFIGRQPLYDRLSESNKQLKQLKVAMDEFKRHHERVKQTEYERALQELRNEKKQILESGTADELLEIDDKIDEAKEKLKEAKQAPKQPEIDQQAQKALETWMESNQWYRKDLDMKEEADYIGYKFVQDQAKSTGVVPTPEEVLQKITREMRKRHPENFVNPRKSEPSKVETEDGTSRRASRKSSDVVLSEDEQRVMKRLVRSGLMTEEQYKADIKAAQESGR